MKKFILYIAFTLALLACTRPTTNSDGMSEALRTTLAEAEQIGEVHRIAVSSATQVGFLQALGEADRIVGICTPDLVYNLPDCEFVDLGPDFQLSIEQLLLCKPDILLATRYDSPMPCMEQAEKAGIRVLYLSEWQETSPIARTNWLRVIAKLVNQESLADSLLNDIQQRYDSIASTVSRRRKGTPDSSGGGKGLLTGQSYRGTWYMASGNSYMGQLFRDAGAEYRFSERQETSSIPMTIEQVMLQFGEADIWVGVQAESLEELAAMDSNHRLFKAFQTGNVYNWNNRVTSTGGNDFWETGILHPEYILQDLQWALGNNEDSIYEPHFIKKIKGGNALRAEE